MHSAQLASKLDAFRYSTFLFCKRNKGAILPTTLKLLSWDEALSQVITTRLWTQGLYLLNADGTFKCVNRDIRALLKGGLLESFIQSETVEYYNGITRTLCVQRVRMKS